MCIYDCVCIYDYVCVPLYFHELLNVYYVRRCMQTEREGERKGQVFKSYKLGASCPSGPKTGKVL